MSQPVEMSRLIEEQVNPDNLSAWCPWEIKTLQSDLMHKMLEDGAANPDGHKWLPETVETDNDVQMDES